MADPRLVCEQLHTLLQSEAERRLDNDFVYRMLEMGFDNACRIDIVEHMSKVRASWRKREIAKNGVAGEALREGEREKRK